MRRPGNTIVEVLLAIAVAGIVVASISNLVIAVNRVDRGSAHKDQALSYAREALDIIVNIASSEFGRTSGCPVGATLPGYTSCWVECPVSGCSTTGYQLASSPSWHLVAGSESLGSSPVFTRSITITDNGTPNNKTISVTISWTEAGENKQITQKTIVTGWKNL